MIQEQQPGVEELEAQMVKTKEELQEAFTRVEEMDKEADTLLKKAEGALKQVTDDFVKEGEEVEE